MQIPKSVPVFGDKNFRGECHKEVSEQITFFNVLRKDYPDLADCATHIRNEGKRSKMQASKEKTEGMLTGASDVIIMGSPTFVCELKRKDHTKSRISKEQVQFLNAAKANGAFACVALGWEAAIRAVDLWIDLSDRNNIK